MSGVLSSVLYQWCLVYYVMYCTCDVYCLVYYLMNCTCEVYCLVYYLMYYTCDVWCTASYVSVPDLLTIPIHPCWWICPGIIPILHLPGAIIPGQLGPKAFIHQYWQQKFKEFIHQYWRQKFNRTFLKPYTVYIYVLSSTLMLKIHILCYLST